MKNKNIKLEQKNKNIFFDRNRLSEILKSEFKIAKLNMTREEKRRFMAGLKDE